MGTQAIPSQDCTASREVEYPNYFNQYHNVIWAHKLSLHRIAKLFASRAQILPKKTSSEGSFLGPLIHFSRPPFQSQSSVPYTRVSDIGAAHPYQNQSWVVLSTLPPPPRDYTHYTGRREGKCPKYFDQYHNMAHKLSLYRIALGSGRSKSRGEGGLNFGFGRGVRPDTWNPSLGNGRLTLKGGGGCLENWRDQKMTLLN